MAREAPEFTVAEEDGQVVVEVALPTVESAAELDCELDASVFHLSVQAERRSGPGSPPVREPPRSSGFNALRPRSAASGDAWPEFPQDSSCDNPRKLLDAAEAIFECGKTAMNQEEFQLAEKKMTKSLRYIERACACTDQAKEQQLAVLLSRAICRHNTGQFSAAVQDCDAMLQLESGNMNALYWRGCSLMQEPTREGSNTLACLREAAKDLEEATRLSDNRATFLAKLHEVQAKVKKAKTKEKSFYSNMFS